VLETAANGVYPIERIEKMAQDRVKRFFQRGKGEHSDLVRVRPELRGVKSKILVLSAGVFGAGFILKYFSNC